MSEALTSAVESAYEAFNDGLEQGGESLSSGLDSVMGLLTEGFNLFGGESGNIGDMLTQMGMDILTNAASNITDTLMENLTEAFEEMIQNFIAALMEEIVKSIAMMGIGAATSGALCQVIPILAAVKAVAETIKTLLDALASI